MAYLQNGRTTISDTRAFSFANSTFQNGANLSIDFAHTFQGTIAGYTAGGYQPATPNLLFRIDKFPFATDTNATTTGNLPSAGMPGGGSSSDTHGYLTFGWTGSPTARKNEIYKFPFSMGGDAYYVGRSIDVGSGGAYHNAGHSSSTHGYAAGGFPGGLNTIEKYSFSVDGNSTDVGDLTQARDGTCGQSSTTHGYTSGGNTPAPVNIVDKFSFTTDGNAADVGDLTQSRSRASGQSSTASGHTSGGRGSPSTTVLNTIDKFPFASDSNATDVGDLTAARSDITGQSSTASGYTAGGANGISPITITNIIDKFPFASNTNATDVGDLTQAKGFASGNGQQD